MKRLNAETGKPFKQGNVREDGLVFWGYRSRVKRNGFFSEDWLTKDSFDHKRKYGKIREKETNYEEVRKYRKSKRGHVSQLLNAAKNRSKAKNLAFDIDLDYLESIATSECPIFKTVFSWGRDKKGRTKNSPSLDRIIPELGYIKGNLVFISDLANMIKQNVTEVELYAVADWLHDERKKVLNAYKGQFTPIPETNGRKSKDTAEHGSVHGTGSGQDCDGSHHHIGE